MLIFADTYIDKKKKKLSYYLQDIRGFELRAAVTTFANAQAVYINN